jgi:hypothetical protein
MKNKAIMLLFVLPFLFWDCSKDEDCDYQGLSITLTGNITDSFSGDPLSNVVITVRSEYGQEIICHTVSNELGNFIFQFSLYGYDTLSAKVITFSKGGYKLSNKLMKLSAGNFDIDVQLDSCEADSIAPYCFEMQTDHNLDQGLVGVTFFFSEEVITDNASVDKFSQVLFRRLMDPCSSGSFYRYERQSGWRQTSVNAITFYHRDKDLEYCYNNYSYNYYELTVNWSLYSIQLLPGFCADSAGNPMNEFFNWK